MDMWVSLSSHTWSEIWLLVHSLLQTQPVTVCQVMSFLGKANFYANEHSQLQQLCHFIQTHVECYHSSSFYFSISAWCQLQTLSQLQQSPVPLWFTLLLWLLLQMPCPLIGPSFSSCLVTLSVCGSRSGSMCWVHIALQELQAVALMLCQMTFH